MILFSSVVIKWFVILVNRVASWFGSGYFIRKGRREKRRRYYLVAVIVSALMFSLLLFYSHLRKQAELAIHSQHAEQNLN